MKHILLILIISTSTIASDLFTINFSLDYKSTVYEYTIDISTSNTDGIISTATLYKNGKYNSSKITKIEKMRNKKSVAKAPLRGFDLLYLYRVTKNKYVLTYPVDMLDGNWKNFVFTVESNTAYNKELPVSLIEFNKVNYVEKFLLGKIPVGINNLKIQ